MAFETQYDRGKLTIFEPVIRRAVFTNLLTLTADDDPLSANFCEFVDDLGYITMGTLVLDLPATEAEFRTRTPSTLVARALTQRDWQWNMSPAQWTPHLWENVMRLLVETGSSQAIGFVGPDAPEYSPVGLVAKGKTLDDETWYAAMWYGQPMLDGIQRAFGGTDFSNTPVVMQAQEHPDFAADPWTLTTASKSYGAIWQPGVTS
jgi:hypothetical protein